MTSLLKIDDRDRRGLQWARDKARCWLTACKRRRKYRQIGDFMNGKDTPQDDDREPAWVKRGRWANARRHDKAQRRILEAIAHLHNGGQKIAYRAIREGAGSGSFSTIATVLKFWRTVKPLPWLPVEVIGGRWAGIRQRYKGQLQRRPETNTEGL